MKRYSGSRTIDGIAVTVDGAPLQPGTDLYKLTDRGFEWSYEGPEPAQLAFALLNDHLADAAEARLLHIGYMKQVVANFDNDWELTSTDLDAAVGALRQQSATARAP